MLNDDDDDGNNNNKKEANRNNHTSTTNLHRNSETNNNHNNHSTNPMNNSAFANETRLRAQPEGKADVIRIATIPKSPYSLKVRKLPSSAKPQLVSLIDGANNNNNTTHHTTKNILPHPNQNSNAPDAASANNNNNNNTVNIQHKSPSNTNRREDEWEAFVDPIKNHCKMSDKLEKCIAAFVRNDVEFRANNNNNNSTVYSEQENNDNNTLPSEMLNFFACRVWSMFSNPQDYLITDLPAVKDSTCFGCYFADKFTATGMADLLSSLYDDLLVTFKKITHSSMTLVEFADKFFTDCHINKTVGHSLRKQHDIDHQHLVPIFIACCGESQNFFARYYDPGFLADVDAHMIGDGIQVNNGSATQMPATKLQLEPHVVTILASASGTGKTVTAVSLCPCKTKRTVCVYTVLPPGGILLDLEPNENRREPLTGNQRNRRAFKVLVELLWRAMYIRDRKSPAFTNKAFEEAWEESANPNAFDLDLDRAMQEHEIVGALRTVFAVDSDPQKLRSRIANEFDSDAVLHMVVDQVGPRPGFVRAVLVIWNSVRKVIADFFRVSEAFLTCVGAGADDLSNIHRIGTDVASYRLFRIAPRNLLQAARAYFSPTAKPPPFVKKLLDLLFPSKNVTQQEPVASDLASYRFIQLCSHARCFGIALSFLATTTTTNNNNVIGKDYIRSILPTVNLVCIRRFACLDDRDTAGAAMKIQKFGEALSVVLNRHEGMTESWYKLFAATIGLLGDSSIPLVPASAVDAKVWTKVIESAHDNNNNKNDSEPKIQCYFRSGQSRYIFCEAQAIMFLLKTGTITAEYPSRPSLLSGLFELLCADFHALRLLISPSRSIDLQRLELFRQAKEATQTFVALCDKAQQKQQEIATTNDDVLLASNTDKPESDSDNDSDSANNSDSDNNNNNNNDDAAADTEPNHAKSDKPRHDMVFAQPHVLFCNPTVKTVLRDFSTHKLEEPKLRKKKEAKNQQAPQQLRAPKIENPVLDLSGDIKTQLDAWGAQVRGENGAAVVIRNADQASHADVIVLSPGVLFLTQAKAYLQRNVSAKMIGEEFDKMCFNSPILLEALRRQCMTKDMTTPEEVIVVASVVVALESSLPAYPSKRGYSINLKTPSDAKNIMQFIVPASSNSGANAFYPLGQLRISPATKDHEAFLETSHDVVAAIPDRAEACIFAAASSSTTTSHSNNNFGDDDDDDILSRHGKKMAANVKHVMFTQEEMDAL